MSDFKLSGITGHRAKASAWSKIPAKAETSHDSDGVTLSSGATQELKPKRDFWGWLDKATQFMNGLSEQLQQANGDAWLYDDPRSCKTKTWTPSPSCPKK